jgi:hypothetical protein
VVERFSCAPGPAGWRYVATREDAASGEVLGRIDLVLQASGTVRLEVVGGAWVLRGGVVGDEVLWRRGEDERAERGHGFTGASPSYAVVLSRLGAGVRRLVEVTEPVLATRVVEQVWAHAGQEVRDGLAVDTWRVDEPATGARSVLHLAGDVLLAAPGVRLLELDGAPTLTRP